MTEEFLHYVWQFGQYAQKKLKTTNGQLLNIYNSGFLNENAGPDFFSAKVRVGKTLWVGNVEIHKRSSDWYKHKHHFDEAYNNVILHVVYEHDKEVLDVNGNPIPTLELKAILNEHLFDQYQDLTNRKALIPCDNLISKVDDFAITHWVDSVAIQRLARKSDEVCHLIKANNNDLEESFYQLLAGGFGFKVNREPFAMLAKQVTLNNLLRIRNSTVQLEAIMLGGAGFLKEQFEEEYPQVLKREYRLLENKFNINQLNSTLWKFYLLRPGNFPTIRIVQLAALIKDGRFSVSDIIEIDNVDELINRLRVSPSGHWSNHYTLGKPSPKHSKKTLGINAANNLIINVIVPFLFAYGRLAHREDLKEKAVYFLEKLPSEKNKLIKMWELLGVRAINAFRSQGLIELKNQFCFEKKCLNCNIGKFILKNKISDTEHTQFL